MRFYGIQPSEIENLDSDDAHRLLLAMPILEARERLKAMKVADHPYTKDERRDEIFRDLNKVAFNSIIKEEPRAITTADLARILNQGV